MAFNWSAGTAGGLSGAGSGAYLGSYGGPAAPITIPIGAILGALFGTLGGGYGSNQDTEEFFGGTGPSAQPYGGLEELLQSALKQYQNPTQGFEPIKQDIGNYFKSDILPHIQNQFNAQSGGHFSSGILGSNVARGQMGLADRLASAQAQYGQNQQSNALSAIQAARPQYAMSQGQPGLNQNLMQLLPQLLQAYQSYKGGGAPGSGGSVDMGSFGDLGSQIKGYQPNKLPWQV